MIILSFYKFLWNQRLYIEPLKSLRDWDLARACLEIAIKPKESYGVLDVITPKDAYLMEIHYFTKFTNLSKFIYGKSFANNFCSAMNVLLNLYFILYLKRIIIKSRGAELKNLSEWTEKHKKEINVV